RTVVQEETEDFEALAEGSGKEVTQEGLEIRKAAPGITSGEGVSTGDPQPTKHLQCSPALIAIGHLHRMARDSSLGLMPALACLERRLFIRPAGPLSAGRQPGGSLIELPHRGGFLDKVGVGRVLPRMISPGFNLILPQPAADGAGRDRRNA